jgi:hypothetical protein
MGLGKDTHTTPSQYSYLALAFYVSYFACELPTGYLLQKLPVAKYLGINGMIPFSSHLHPTNIMSMKSYSGAYAWP